MTKLIIILTILGLLALGICQMHNATNAKTDIWVAIWFIEGHISLVAAVLIGLFWIIHTEEKKT